jgi:NADH-ubiquinone oxidoreductase chain 5
MYLTILILPFLGSLTAGFFGRKIGVKGAHFITCTCVLLSAVLATIAFYEVGVAGSPVYVHLCN